MSFFDRLLSVLEARYPQTARSHDLRVLLSDKLVSPHHLQLPSSVRDQAQNTVDVFFELRNSAEFRASASSIAPEVTIHDPGNFSALMSFDFHLTKEGGLKLIEVNTNASMGLVTEVLYETMGRANPFGGPFRDEIFATFQEEYALAKPARPLRTVAIIDEEPPTQKLFVEFLLYQELFRNHGLECLIADPSELKYDAQSGSLSLPSGRQIDLIYNRFTDFYFETAKAAAMRTAYLKQQVCITPNPHEYHLLADKQRLQELTNPKFNKKAGLTERQIEMLKTVLPTSVDTMEIENPDDLWQDRKKLFFKPKRSYGGKAAYKGASMSRGVFDRILKEDYLAQEYIPTQTMKVQLEDGKEAEFKYDLRFFVYKNKIQLAAARLYQGQLTNFQTVGGGMATVSFADH